MKRAIITLFFLSIGTGAAFAQNTTPGGMPAPDMSNPHPQKNAAQRAEAERAAQGAPSSAATSATTTASGALSGNPQPAAAAGGGEAGNPRAGKFKFESMTHNFGNVAEGQLAIYEFKFKNVGQQPIVIADAHGSCSCTTATWTQDPILPKQSGVIKVTFNSAGRPGQIAKDVIVNSNARQSPLTLHITGNVTPRPKK